MDLFGKTLSNLISSQFPEYFREHGPLFVSFVTEYYKWLETRSPSRDPYFVDKVSLIGITNRSANVVGKGSFFKTQFANGDLIAVSKGSETTDYDMFKIKNVIDDLHLTLTPDKLPNFTHPNTRYGTVSSKPNALFLTRNFSEINDIDETFDEYVVYFKEKYLKNIQFETITNTRKLIKHSLDLYRSKGTDRSIDLLYKIVFGTPASVYYPGRDIFRLSSGDWYIPQYLELSLSPDNRKLINKEITGVISGATAFVEEIIRRVIGSKVVEIAFISTIRGIFITGEKVTLTDKSLEIARAPTITGSLNDVAVAVTGSGQGFVNNQPVTLTSLNGRDAKGKVTGISNTEGAMTFTFVDGGYGYVDGSNEVATYVSDKILTVSNATLDADFFNHEYVAFLGTLTQPIAILNFVNANGAFAVGDGLRTYWPNNFVKGTGSILVSTTTTANSGILTIAVLSGDMNEPAIYKTANAVVANLAVANGYVDLTVTAKVIGNYSNVIIQANNYAGEFITGEEIVQPGTEARGIVTASFFNEANTQVTVFIANSEGIFKNALTVTGSNSGVTASVLSTKFDVGIVNASGDFYTLPNNYVYTNDMQGTVESVSSGSGADLTFSNTLTYTEVVSINEDIIQPHLTEVFNGTYNFPANHTATRLSVIANTLTFTTRTIGKISAMLSTSPGIQYTKAPIVKLMEPDIYQYQNPDTIVLNVLTTAGYQVGELVVQSATNARGIVEEIFGDSLVVQNLRFFPNNYFVTTSNSSTTILGTGSGVITNATSVAVRGQSARLGDDIAVDTILTVGTGAITSIQILDSGFGFLNGEVVTIANGEFFANGYATLHTHGTGSGYYKSRDGFLSDTKKLSDGYYWQEYSYEVRSSVIDEFKKTLKNIVHVAGTKYFDALYYDSVNPANTDINITMSVTGPGGLLLRDGSSLLLRDGTSALILSHT